MKKIKCPPTPPEILEALQGKDPWQINELAKAIGVNTAPLHHWKRGEPMPLDIQIQFLAVLKDPTTAPLTRRKYVRPLPLKGKCVSLFPLNCIEGSGNGED